MRKTLLACRAALTVLLCLGANRSTADTVPFSAPPNSSAWQLVESMSDEFTDAELDTAKWHIQGTDGIYESNFQGRADAFAFSTDNARVEDGRLKIQSKWDSSAGIHTTAAVISKNTLHYGYMETRAKVADAAVSSSFWMTGNGGDRTASELDVYELFGAPHSNPNISNIEQRYWSSIHDWSADLPTEHRGKSTWTDTDTYLDFDPADDFHVYGVEWTEEYLKFHVDDQLLRVVTRAEVESAGLNSGAWAIDDPLRIWVDSEVFPWIDTPPESASFEAVYEVDYIRVWQPVAVPEPSVFALMGIGTYVATLRRRRNRR
ncbi:Beta-porphyranase B precursor [Planctomycetes bacterium CA13]|uniref:Beta-porphyranase B n=1 Tax=Novipirellula herctigrandis TaxID=2527986 RepID=A0A5C5Z8T7_9BACT|nr:Beta-porphyranase B precursor [Planctomycetes bacterium CA13]